jgi:hypothetical protein
VDRLIFYDFPPRVFLLVYLVFGLLVAVTFFLVPPQLPRWQKRTREGAVERLTP